MTYITNWQHSTIPNFKVRPYQQKYFYEVVIDYIREQMALTKQIENYTPEPAFINASVGTGKSLGIAMLAKHVSDKGGKVLALARQGELVEQNSDECWALGVKNGIYSASLNQKNTLFNVIIGTEGTVKNGILNDLAEWGVPDIVMVDECHMIDFHEPDSQYMRILAHYYALNPRLIVIGLTGSPFRGIEPILFQDEPNTPPDNRGFIFSRRNQTHALWKHELCNISTEWAIEQNYLVPPMFGFPPDVDDMHYSYEGIEPSASTGDYTESDLDKVARQQEHKLRGIIDELVTRTRDRNVVLIYAASKRHCRQIEKLLPDGQCAVVHDGTGKQKRRDYINAARDYDRTKPESGFTPDGKTRVKYLVNVGTLVTGVNIPTIDCVAYLRAVGSLTLLIQSIGRGLRLCASVGKRDCLVLDYAEVMVRLGSLYANPILEQAELERSQNAGNVKLCPKCNTENGEYARRCRGDDLASVDGRCEFFFESIECDKCGTHNDIVARDCRNCGAELKDPNEKLVGKAYTSTDWKQVHGFNLRLTKDAQGLLVEYQLDDEIGREILHPNGGKPWQKAKWKQFLRDHVNCTRMRSQVSASVKSAKQALSRKAMFDVPTYITHRVNDKGFSIIHNKKFKSGREAQADE